MECPYVGHPEKSDTNSETDVVLSLPSEEQLNLAWTSLLSMPRTSEMIWPSVAEIGDKVFNSDYSKHLACSDDFQSEPEKNPRVLCANGFISKIAIGMR